MTKIDQLAKLIDNAVANSKFPQKKVAELAGVDVSSLSRWRRGLQRCPAYRVGRLAEALNLTKEETERMQKLALDAEADEHKNKAAVRSLAARRDIEELRLSIQQISQRITRIERILKLESEDSI
jgi:transcriptional regulator with XRE-family HTH domain